jgi:hypothetical protein
MCWNTKTLAKGNLQERRKPRKQVSGLLKFNDGTAGLRPAFAAFAAPTHPSH